MSKKTLLEIHEDVPAEHYDVGISHNLFQKYWHKRRFEEVTKVIVPVEGAVLDVGCHGGTFTERILSKIGSKKIYGVDVSASAIKKIQKRFPFGQFKLADAAELPFKSNFFDAVFCLEVLEHVDNPEKAIAEIKRVLRPGGYAVLLVPSESLLFKFVWFLWTLYYPIWRHAHVQSFHHESLEAMLRKSQLKIKHIKTFHLGMLKMVVVVK
jgi:2-polyprenyl-6-hydroxyphenyl methylase / 3-demethylubiquinone-9 3-methyltransferase